MSWVLGSLDGRLEHGLPWTSYDNMAIHAQMPCHAMTKSSALPQDQSQSGRLPFAYRPPASLPARPRLYLATQSRVCLGQPRSAALGCSWARTGLIDTNTSGGQQQQQAAWSAVMTAHYLPFVLASGSCSSAFSRSPVVSLAPSVICPLSRVVMAPLGGLGIVRRWDFCMLPGLARGRVCAGSATFPRWT